MNRTKIAIIGADMSAFHLFNTVYRSDDRYEVICFVDIRSPNVPDNLKPGGLYPAFYAGSLYPQGIVIIRKSPFQNEIKESTIEKCIFAPSCVTSCQYLYLAAQCMAAQSSVISPSLELTRLPPPKPLVSFFSDTQFDIPILMHLLDTYKKSSGTTKPVVIMPGPLQLFSSITKGHEGVNFILLKNQADYNQYSSYLTRHQQEMCNKLLLSKYSIYFVYDFEQFSTEQYRTDTFNLIVFVGFNSLPCYFNSHLVVYACDEFTFPDDISEHPSSVLCRQADIILYAEIIPSPEKISALATFSACDKIVPIQISYKAKNIDCYPKKTALLVDDTYPTRQCNAARSISKFLAETSHMKPLPLPSESEAINVVSDSPIYGEPTEKNWPAIILPESDSGVTIFNEQILNDYSGYDLIVSTTNEPRGLKPPTKQTPIMQFSFELDLRPLNSDLFELPSGAFVKPRK